VDLRYNIFDNMMLFRVIHHILAFATVHHSL